MSFNYYAADTAKGQKHARLYLPKEGIDESLSCQIGFSELIIQKDDKFYVCTGKIGKHTTGIKENFKERACSGETVIFKLLNVPENETTYQNKTIKKTQSKLEKYICGRFDSLDLDKAYSGHIRFRFDGMLDYYLGGSLSGGMLNDFLKNSLTLTALEQKTIELESGGGKGNGRGGYTNKSENEKHLETMQFRLEQLSTLGTPIPDFKTFVEIVSDDAGKELMLSNLEWLSRLTK